MKLEVVGVKKVVGKASGKEHKILSVLLQSRKPEEGQEAKTVWINYEMTTGYDSVEKPGVYEGSFDLNGRCEKIEYVDGLTHFTTE